MKIKLTSQELLAISPTINELCRLAIERASLPAVDGMPTVIDLMARMVALSLVEFAIAYNNSVRYLPNGKASIKFKPVTGLAFLTAWYATDSTELPMTPLSAAVLNHITDILAKTYASTTITNHF